jgi:hypothetical protein
MYEVWGLPGALALVFASFVYSSALVEVDQDALETQIGFEGLAP